MKPCRGGASMLRPSMYSRHFVPLRGESARGALLMGTISCCNAPILAEKRHPLRELPVGPNRPKGLSILTDVSSNTGAFSASTA
jgi:hypothetical protein